MLRLKLVDLLREKIVETVPEKVPNCCNDENACQHPLYQEVYTSQQMLGR